jgi:antitoxin component YwqK of YwqJK toxin-antitoxin module
MKNIITVTAILFATSFYAQAIETKYEIEGNKVIATYFHDNGQVKQTGAYKNGKVEGNWTLYSETGQKMAQGEYSQGKKVGKWLFWDANALNEVDYADSRIAEVKKWSNQTIVLRN